MSLSVIAMIPARSLLCLNSMGPFHIIALEDKAQSDDSYKGFLPGVRDQHLPVRLPFGWNFAVVELSICLRGLAAKRSLNNNLYKTRLLMYVLSSEELRKANQRVTFLSGAPLVAA